MITQELVKLFLEANKDHNYQGQQQLLKGNGLTALYGHSDDCIEFVGMTYGEWNWWHDQPKSKRFEFEDGTKVSIIYGKGGIWKIKVLKVGTAEQFLHVQEEENEYGYSDVFFIKSKKKGKQDGE